MVGGGLIVFAPTPPSERLAAVAERAAAALALHRLHDRQRDSAVRRTHHELMLGLLSDPTGPELLRRCEVAGVAMTRRRFVGVTLRPQFDTGTAGSPSALVEEAISATVHAAHELKVPALVCEVERDVRVLLSFPSAAPSGPDRGPTRQTCAAKARGHRRRRTAGLSIRRDRPNLARGAARRAVSERRRPPDRRAQVGGRPLTRTPRDAARRRPAPALRGT